MIGIFGGTFDPVHYGHLRSALEVKDIFGLTEVRLIPCANPPHREQPCVSADMRLEMLRLSIQHQPGLIVDTRELDRQNPAKPTPSYMVDTLRSLKQQFPNESLLLFIGTDAFEHLTAWHQWQQLFDYAHIAVMTRPGYQIQSLSDFFNARLVKDKLELLEVNEGKLCFQQVTQLDISATAIRKLMADNLNAGFLLPDAVIEYIKRHRLYGVH